ncbi:uncharacterized protein [Polyergus mexicanus]|uniref:uncharacterized protein n=1 Tax=Polyergus mexicanus TaxID=615972 RepID=UPI0038B5BC79
MAATDISERKKTAKEIAKTRASIRKKHRALKTGKIETAMESRFKPIVEPLQRIAEHVERDEIKREMIKRDAMDTSSATTSIEKKWKEEARTPAWKKPKVKQIRARRRLDAVSTPLSKYSTERDSFARDETEEEAFKTENLESASKFEMPVRRTSQITHGREMSRDRLGSLGPKYMGALLGGEAPNELDHVYGAYIGAKGTMLGNKRFDIDPDHSIFIDKIKYIGTPGLYELIFVKNPDNLMYTEKDKLTYKNILLMTNAHRRDHDARKSFLGNKGYKYKSIIAPLIHGSGAKKTGAGRVPSTMRVTDDKIDYIYWVDSNNYDAKTGRLRPAIESLRNYVRDNALCLSSSTEYDAREREIKCLSQPEEDADATSKSYVEGITSQLRKDANEAEQGVILLFARLAQLDNALGKRIDAAESYVSKIETRNDVLSKRIDAEENSVSRTEASTDALGKRIDALDKRINSLSEQLDAAKKTISLNAAESLTRSESDRKIQFNQAKIIQELTKKSRVAEKILELENSTSQLKRNTDVLSEKVTELMNRKKREL